MKFLKTLLASTLGVLLAFVIVVIVGFIILSIIISNAGNNEPHVADNTVLKMDISGPLPAHSSVNPFERLFERTPENTVSLESLKSNLTKAASDDNIKGVLLEINSMSEGWANLQEARQIISQFRDTTRKFIYATTNDAGFNEKGYYLATAVDSIFAPPESFFELDGFYTQVTFLKGLFDKLGVQVQIARHGKYKGAVEPLIRKKLSKANKYQLTQLLNDVSGEFFSAAAQKTGETADSLNAMLNKAPHLTASYGYRHGFIDSLLYANQLDSLINKRIGLKKGQHFHSIGNEKYAQVSFKSAGVPDKSADGAIAIIYASGAIMPETTPQSSFNPETNITASWFKKQLQKVEDSHAKALVIRLNSPGGSGSASDAIWNMIRQTKKNIPVIVSMGPVAASGGYYIAVAADSIVTEPTTITGSIGVFATNFDSKKFFNDKLGITFDEVQSNKHADWLSPTHALSPEEKGRLFDYITEFYQTFVSKVAKARGLSVAKVKELAQGRVWSGVDAKANHLVDVLGGLDKAEQIAADKAGLKHWNTETYPKQKGLFQTLMNATQTKAQAMWGSPFSKNEKLRELSRQLSLLKKRGALLLFPYDINMQ